MRLFAIDPANEDLTRGFLNKEARWIEVAIEELSRRQKFSRLIKLAIENEIKRSWRVSIDSLSVESYRETIEIALKKFFKEEKNTDMNAIKYATQPKIQIAF